ncbi:MAG: hypothetical protein J7L53_01855 [Deltaproteobacteria bacterium]|nr:hypothetical protein [Deltaproteobacteria bacterium]
MNAARFIMRRGLWPAAIRIHDELETQYFQHQDSGSQMTLMFDGLEELCDLELKETMKIAHALKAEDLGEGPAREWWGKKRFSIAFPTSDHPLFGIPFPGYIRVSGCIDSAGSFDYLVAIQRKLKETVEKMNMFLAAHFSHFYPTGGMIYPTFVGQLKKGTEAARTYNEIWRRGIVLSHNLKDQAPCCGYGVGLEITHPEITKLMALRLVSLAEDAGAEVMVMGCPTCRNVILENLGGENDSNKPERKGSVDILDLPLFLERVL